ncbi:hypothetical protein Sjap_019866 [Stephania japonica]|uniref:Uncharacterized protein n=1 Tax=Stephania japonica TaxID=461633 RepID=A0AAP0HYI2_9MAGN
MERPRVREMDSRDEEKEERNEMREMRGALPFKPLVKPVNLPFTVDWPLESSRGLYNPGWKTRGRTPLVRHGVGEATLPPSLTLESASEGSPQCSPALGTPPPRLASRSVGRSRVVVCHPLLLHGLLGVVVCPPSDDDAAILPRQSLVVPLPLSDGS